MPTSKPFDCGLIPVEVIERGTGPAFRSKVPRATSRGVTWDA